MSLSEPGDLHTTLTPLLAALQRGLGPRLIALALFGSRARGDAGPESDWDFLLIASRLPEKPLQRHFYIKTMLPDDWRAQASLLAKTPDEFETRLPSLYLDIALDSILLYDPQGYLQQRLDRLRRLMKRLNLRRERVADDWAWRWQRTPPEYRSLTWETVP